MRVLLTGGGTGGHVYPGLTLWRYILQMHPEAEVLYIGSNKGLEREIVAHAGLPFVTVPATGLKRQISLDAFRTLWTVWRGYRAARRLINNFRPDVAVGTGGYVALPVIWAASRMGIPTVVWEANARPGLTNQLLSYRAKAVAVSFIDTQSLFSHARKVTFTGHPRGSEVRGVNPDAVEQVRKDYGIPQGSRLVVIFAGSRGAATINQVVKQMWTELARRTNWYVVHATGEDHFQQIQAESKDCPKNVRLTPFIHNMPALMSLADVLVTRAGGATLAEICSFALPSILIPSPYVTANHQEENARRLVERGAAKLILEADLSAPRLLRELQLILETSQGSVLADNARRLAVPDAVHTLYQLVMEICDCETGTQ
ncbi:undecaprenyldiphospho-muramoylpentapeptide beta-N-acetylglucosaminyltransferase [Alicyclobacillaceae bacterium I2511]|nr:undecaprenyldiphospho-muramoylpentapeptide beta-N-acetylglucosaminyltransferase [Alicyclobacillaceae bacterium I2511]